MAKDYYLILGVRRDADQEEIKSAYRRAVKDHHPDVSKSPDKEKFIEIQEAYDVLKDPEKKRAYDESLRRAERKARTIYRDYPRSFTRSRSDPFFSFFDDLFEDISSIFSHSFRPPRSRTYTAEIILTPEGAEAGGYLPLSIPIDKPCIFCNGKGSVGFFTCPECLGQGTITTPVHVKVQIPPNVKHGTVLEINLEKLGGKNFLIQLKILVS